MVHRRNMAAIAFALWSPVTLAQEAAPVFRAYILDVGGTAVLVTPEVAATACETDVAGLDALAQERLEASGADAVRFFAQLDAAADAMGPPAVEGAAQDDPEAAPPLPVDDAPDPFTQVAACVVDPERVAEVGVDVARTPTALGMDAQRMSLRAAP